MALRKQRLDGWLVEDGDPMNLITPYMMPSRIESQVFYSYAIPYDNISAYINEQRKQGKRITFFNILVAAIQRTMAERPKMNRFVAGRRLYQRNNFEVLYVVKDSISDEGNESVARIAFDKNDNLTTVAAKMDYTNHVLRAGKENLDDKAIRLLLKLPRFMIRSVFAFYRWLDYHGIAPRAAIEQFPFYSSIFISHLGTIGGDAVFHHLYEIGTCSLFLTIGRLKKRPFYENDQVSWRKSIELAFTVDERICDGYYLIKSLKRLNYYLLNPALLESSLDNEANLELDTSKIKVNATNDHLWALARVRRYMSRPLTKLEAWYSDNKEDASINQNSDEN